MSKFTKTLDKILRGNADANIRFSDLCALLHHFGFAERIRGDHHIFTRDGVAEILNLQPRGDKAKVYQVKQVRGVLTAHQFLGNPEPSKLTEKKTRNRDTDSEQEEKSNGG